MVTYTQPTNERQGKELVLNTKETNGHLKRVDEALSWAEAGFYVFPCLTGGKKPACKNGLHDATRNPDRIRELWSDPYFNIGCAPDLSGYFVLDVDIKKNKSGWETLSDLESTHGELPKTFMVETPSGGRHLWFKGQAPSSASKKSLGSGLDIRGIGGYVLLPPSIADGAAYDFAYDHDVEIAPTPDWLTKLASQPVREPLKRPDGASLDAPEFIEYLTKEIDALIEQGDVAIEYSGGNARTYKLANFLLDYLSPEAALPLLQKWNVYCLPPWSDGELETILNNAIKYRQNDIGAKAGETEKEYLQPESAIQQLNKEYAVTIAGGKAAILMETTDLDGHPIFHLLPPGAFTLWMANRFVLIPDGDKETKPVKLSKYWLEHPDRRQYKEIAFSPNKETPGDYNLWKGFAYVPKAGKCDKFLEHVWDNVCCGNNEHAKWVVGWFADIFQHPDIKCSTSLTLRGKQGTGKTIVGKIIGKLLGNHYRLVTKPRYITGQFNSHLLSCLLLQADEGFWAGDKSSEGALKDLVTGDSQAIEYKGKEAFWVKNYSRLLVTSNNEWIVPAGFEERRFTVLNVGDGKMQDQGYFVAIQDEMNNGGYEALLDYLLNYDLSVTDIRQILETDALIEQKINSMSSEQAWWMDRLTNGELPFDTDEAADDGKCPSKELFEDYINHAQRQGARRRSIETQVGRFLTNTTGAVKVRGAYRFPSLSESRAKFAAMLQNPSYNWPDHPLTWHRQKPLVDSRY